MRAIGAPARDIFGPQQRDAGGGQLHRCRLNPASRPPSSSRSRGHPLDQTTHADTRRHGCLFTRALGQTDRLGNTAQHLTRLKRLRVADRAAHIWLTSSKRGRNQSEFGRKKLASVRLATGPHNWSSPSICYRNKSRFVRNRHGWGGGLLEFARSNPTLFELSRDHPKLGRNCMRTISAGFLPGRFLTNLRSVDQLWSHFGQNRPSLG